MPDQPRRLRVLRIDDDLAPGDRPGVPIYAAQKAPAHLESVELTGDGQSVFGIRSWSDAIDFWARGERVAAVDLIVSDIRFYDRTSPLTNLPAGAQLELPTGLSHFKAFAAFARAQGRPIGIGLHTKEPNLWSNLARDKDENRRFMAFLAAHEAGELAAILGEADGLGARDAEACWAWLAGRTFDSQDFLYALPLALQQFRRKLGAMQLLPKDYDTLVGWCGRLEASAGEGAGPNAKAAIRLDAKEDIGFPVYRPDGTRDVISIRSLFADVLIDGDGFAFEREGLPRKCFAMEAHADFHMLDDGRPRIGALVHACGDLARAYGDAVELARRFAPPRDAGATDNFASARAETSAGNLAAALAILLLEIEREYALLLAWRNLYESSVWDPATDAFTGAAPIEHWPLRTWVERAAKMLRQQGRLRHADLLDLFEEVAPIDEDDWSELEAADEDDDERHNEAWDEDAQGGGLVAKRRGAPGARRCTALLVALKVARYDKRGQFYVPDDPKASPDRLPPRPKLPPTYFRRQSQLGAAFRTKDPSSTLRLLMGYHTSSDAIVARTIASGFGVKDKGWGTKFLAAFRAGSAPVGWVHALCRDYARERGWTDETTWPPSLTGRAEGEV